MKLNGCASFVTALRLTKINYCLVITATIVTQLELDVSEVSLLLKVRNDSNCKSCSRQKHKKIVSEVKLSLLSRIEASLEEAVMKQRP